MKLIALLHRWKCSFLKQGETPAFIPLTREELNVVASELPAAQWNQTFMVNPPEVFGLSVFDSPFAEEMRARQISLPVTQLAESVDIPFRLYESRGDVYYDNVTRLRLVANICSDTTHLDLTFEFDPWATFKRKLKLTKWFPVRTKTIRIDARILYPYIKVSLPCNKHHVQFQHVQ